MSRRDHSLLADLRSLAADADYCGEPSIAKGVTITWLAISCWGVAFSILYCIGAG